MNKELERPGFEAHLRCVGYDDYSLRRSSHPHIAGEDYVWTDVNQRWETWLAARAASQPLIDQLQAALRRGGTGCGLRLAPDQYWGHCGATDMGGPPNLCTECGGNLKRALPAAPAPADFSPALSWSFIYLFKGPK